MRRRLGRISYGFVFTKVGMIWAFSWGKLMWGRIWRVTGMMGILPCARVLRRVVLALGQECFRHRIPVPVSPVATRRDSLGIPQPLEFSFDRTCAPSDPPRADGAQYEELAWGQLRDQCSQQGYRLQESKAVFKTRLTTMDAAEAKRRKVGNANGRPRRGRWSRIIP